MRTTLTLDDDVAVLLERVRQTDKLTLKEAVNQALRRGLHEMAAKPDQPQPFRTRTASLGRCLIGSLDNIGEVLAIAEGEDYKRS
jgi:hypothetical protein